jgi:hypothetical protein
VAALSTALFTWLLTPAVVNGDGLGYLKAAPTGKLYPGHLAYLPILRALGRITGHESSLGLLGPARALSILSGAVAVLALFGVARRLIGDRAALIAAIGIGVSFGALQAAADVESYAPALGAICLATYCAARRHDGGGIFFAAATAIGVALAALLHIENVLFAPAAALLCAKRRDGEWRILDGALVLFGSGALTLGAYLWAFHLRGDGAASAIHWVVGASHGFSYPLRFATPLIALYGMAKTLVYAPYPHQASWLRVIGQTVAGALGLLAMLWLARRPGRKSALPRAVAAAWILPYAIVGVAFFASDNERWLFLLPPAWLAVAAGAETSLRALRVASGLIAALVILDVALGLPLARESEMRDRSAALTAQVAPHDLVISPGHSWDEYIGFYQEVDLDRFPMIYFCGDLGGPEPMKAELAHRVVDARARGSRVFLARVDEPENADGWKELALFGITPSNVGQLLPDGKRVNVAPGLVRLDP